MKNAIEENELMEQKLDEGTFNKKTRRKIKTTPLDVYQTKALLGSTFGPFMPSNLFPGTETIQTLWNLSKK